MFQRAAKMAKAAGIGTSFREKKGDSINERCVWLMGKAGIVAVGVRVKAGDGAGGAWMSSPPVFMRYIFNTLCLS